VLDASQVFGESELEDMIGLFKTTEVVQVKKAILETYFSKVKNQFDLRSLLQEELLSETSSSLKLHYLKVMLLGFSTISDYLFVSDYLNNNSQDSIASLVDLELKLFRPSPEATSIEVSIMLDTLTSYTNQCYSYEWLKSEVFKNELLNIITSAKNHLNSNDSLSCRNDVASLQNSVNQVYSDSAGSYPKYVSNEGYKFLYYYAQYILDRLPELAEGLPVKLQDSQGNLLQGGFLQYYDGSWMDAANNGNGTFNVITERTTVSIRMTYEGGSQQLDNVVVGPDTAAFQTVNAAVQLLNSQGNLITADETVQYYAGSWREFGTTVSGTVSKELLPKNYSFRITYEGVSNDKQQDIGVENTVSFSTVLCVVQVKDSQNQPVDGAEVKYYSGSWRDIGITANGEVSKELLPKNLSFRVIYNGVTQNKQQDPSLPILVREKN
jgi:hypothetical protein